MKKLLVLAMASSHLFAANYKCDVIVHERVKVKRVTHHFTSGIDYKEPIDPEIIIDQKVITPRGVSENLSDYGFTARSQGTTTHVMFTNLLPHKLSSFSFSDDISEARQFPNAGETLFLSMKDALGEPLAYGSSDSDIEVIDNSDQLGMKYMVWNLLTYDPTSEIYTLKIYMNKMGWSEQEAVRYTGTTKVFFKKGTPLVAGELGMNVGFYDVKDETIFDKGSTKTDFVQVACNKVEEGEK